MIMRTNPWLIFALLALAFPAWSQVNMATRPMSKGYRPAFTLLVDSLSKREIKKLLKDHLRDITGQRPRRKKGEYYVEHVFVRWADGPINLYADIEERGADRHEVMVWVETDSTFMQVKSREHPVYGWLHGIDYRSEVRAVELKVDSEEDRLKNLERERDHLLREQDRLERNIAEYERKLEDARQRLEQNKAEQLQYQERIAAQQATVQQVRRKMRTVEENRR